MPGAGEARAPQKKKRRRGKPDGRSWREDRDGIDGPRCEATGKTGYRSYRLAERALLKAQDQPDPDAVTPQRVYPCSACHLYHLTKYATIREAFDAAHPR